MNCLAHLANVQRHKEDRSCLLAEALRVWFDCLQTSINQPQCSVLTGGSNMGWIRFPGLLFSPQLSGKGGLAWWFRFGFEPHVLVASGTHLHQTTDSASQPFGGKRKFMFPSPGEPCPARARTRHGASPLGSGGRGASRRPRGADGRSSDSGQPGVPSLLNGSDGRREGLVEGGRAK